MIRVIESFRERYPGRIHTVRYEDLLSDMPRELGGIASFLGFDFDPALIAGFDRTASSIILPSESWKLDEPGEAFVNTNDAYRKIIAEADAGAVEKAVKKEMEAFGYRPYFEEERQRQA